MFDWMELQVFEMQLLELQSSAIWRQKYVDLRVRLQLINLTWSLQWISLEPQLSAENEVLERLEWSAWSFQLYETSSSGDCVDSLI